MESGDGGGEIAEDEVGEERAGGVEGCEVGGVGGVPFVVERGEDGWGGGGAEEEVPFGVVDFAFWRGC